MVLLKQVKLEKWSGFFKEFLILYVTFVVLVTQNTIF